MSMDQAPENNLPPMHQHTDLGLRLAGDVAREVGALRRQVAEAEDHNTELQAVIAAVRAWCGQTRQAATNRLAQGTPDPRYWQGQQDAAKAVWEIVKPLV